MVLVSKQLMNKPYCSSATNPLNWKFLKFFTCSRFALEICNCTGANTRARKKGARTHRNAARTEMCVYCFDIARRYRTCHKQTNCITKTYIMTHDIFNGNNSNSTWLNIDLIYLAILNNDGSNTNCLFLAYMCCYKILSGISYVYYLRIQTPHAACSVPSEVI